MTTIRTFGKSFEVRWQSEDRRRISDYHSCYELVSFSALAAEDQDQFRERLPATLELCWIINPDYEREAPVEIAQWQDAHPSTLSTELPPEAVTENGHYLPPEARGLPIEPDETLKAVEDLPERICLQARVLSILNEVFRGGSNNPNPLSAARFIAGIRAIKATFEGGKTLYLKQAVERDVPDQAKAQWKMADLLSATEETLRDHKSNAAELHLTKDRLSKAKDAAQLTLEEALKKWLRFQPKNMGTNTAARIEKAVKMYTTDPNMRSEAKIAKEFSVTKKTVSVWFKRFEDETGFSVVRHRRHESVEHHLRTEVERSGQHGDGSEHGDEETVQ